jgi:F-type H+-transporting ATPase subunit b
MKRLRRIIPFVVLFTLAAVVLLAAKGEGRGKGEVMNLVWRLVNFVILIGLLWYWLSNRIKKFFSERRTEIVVLLDQVEKAKAEAEKQYALYDEKLKNVQKDIQEIKDVLLGEIEAEKTRIIEGGKTSAERIIEQAKAIADQEVIKARKALRDHVVDLAGEMAESMVSKAINDNDQNRIVEEYLHKVVKEN